MEVTPSDQPVKATTATQPVQNSLVVEKKPEITPVEKKVEEKPTDSKVEEPNDADDIDAKDLIPQEPYLTSPLFYEVANFFGIEQRDWDNAKDQLSVITDWAIESGKSNKIEDVLVTLRKLEDGIMNPGWGEKRFANVYRYLRLQTKADAFQKALSAYKKEGVQ